MKIKLDHVQFTEITYNVSTFDLDITEELESSFEMSLLFSEESPNYFCVVFELNMSKDDVFELSLKANAHFETDKNISEDDRLSPFFKINAPAIAFPYLRSFVSNLTLNSGYNPIILPTFNFVQMAQEKLD